MMGAGVQERADGGIVPSMAMQPQAEALPPPVAPGPECASSAWREAAGWADGADREPWDYVPRPPLVLDDDGYLIADSMPQNERHHGRLAECWVVLEHHFQGRGGAVCGDLSMHYAKGRRDKVVAPDLFVAWAAEASGSRDSYKLWEEPTPDFVLEDLSPSSEREDSVDKRALYQSLGVPEYWMFDETGTCLLDDSDVPLGELLVGYRLRGGKYRRLLANAAGRLPSAALGLELCVREGVVRFFDPVAGEFLHNLDEETARRKAAERDRLAADERAEAERQAKETERRGRVAADERAEAERRRADDAERRIAELEAELRGRGGSG